MANNPGGKLPKFRKGEVILASDLDMLSRLAIRRVQGGAGVLASIVNNELAINVPDRQRRRVPGLLVATIVSEVGGGDYTWTRDFGEGPDSGEEATTGTPPVPSRVAREVNATTGIEVGKKIQLTRLGGVWYFHDPTVGGGDLQLYWSGYPCPGGTTGWAYWGVPEAGGVFFSGSLRKDGAAFSGRWASSAQIQPSFFSTSVPYVMVTIEWTASACLPPNFVAIGPAGIRIRFKATSAHTGATVVFRFGIRSPQYNTQHATAKVERTWTSSSQDSTWVDMTIPQSLLAGIHQAGDQVLVQLEVKNTVNGVASGSLQIDISGIELDGTG